MHDIILGLVMGASHSTYSKTSGEREPLIQDARAAHPPPPRSSLDKVADIIAGLQCGKLPSQEQLDAMIQLALRSNFFRNGSDFSLGILSKNGKQVQMHLRDVFEATLEFGMEKNVTFRVYNGHRDTADNIIQDLLYQLSQLEGPPIHVDAGDAVEAGRERLVQIREEAPTRHDLIHDATAFLQSLKTIAVILLTSAAFRLLLSDIFASTREAISQMASQVGIFAQQVQIAAGSVEMTANMDGGCSSILPQKVEEAIKGVREADEEASTQERDEDTIKDMFIARVQDFIVRSQQDPQSLNALKTLLNILRRYIRQLSRLFTALTESTTGRTGVCVSPEPETVQFFRDAKILLERLASGHSLNPLLLSVAEIVSAIPDDIQAASTSPMDPQVQQYLSTVNDWLNRALSQERPLYATSRSGTRALENIYDDTQILFTSSTATSSFTRSLHDLVDAYDSYITAISEDRTTSRLINAVSIRRAKKDELVQDVMGWVLPRIMHAIERITIPMPRVEYQRDKFKIALDAQKMAPSQPCNIVLGVVPDEVVISTGMEVRLDMRKAAGKLNASTTSYSRMQVHVEGVRMSVREMGYFIAYRGKILGYSDQGLFDLDIGSKRFPQGLTCDIDLSLNATPSDSNLGDALLSPATPAFDVIDVRVSIPGTKLQLNRSKHWILNKILIQRLAGSVVSRVIADFLQRKVCLSLERLSDVLKAAAMASRERRSNDQPMFRAFNYLKVLLKEGLAAFGIVSSDVQTSQSAEDVESHFRTTANLKDVVHTKIAMDASSSSREPNTKKTSVAVGTEEILFPDKAGAYGAENNMKVKDRLVQEVGGAVEQAGGAVKNVVDNLDEVSTELDHADERRKVVRKIESSKKGWSSRVFDMS
ncbi:hypothetical protein H0H92_014328 [Tricholoma furcatifolium]|nr:hypothetical protein H0H92_014328 [Tricholoma furcatifolium]